MEQNVVFVGPAESGKKIAIRTISDAEVVKNETSNTLGKYQTPLAIDYGSLALKGGSKVNLYSAHGKECFSFIRDELAALSPGVVLLINGSSQNPLADLEAYLSAFKNIIGKSAVVVGITHMDICLSPTLNMYNARLDLLSINAPVFEVDPQSRKDVHSLLMALLTILDQRAHRIRGR